MASFVRGDKREESPGKHGDDISAIPLKKPKVLRYEERDSTSEISDMADSPHSLELEGSHSQGSATSASSGGSQGTEAAETASTPAKASLQRNISSTSGETENSSPKSSTNESTTSGRAATGGEDVETVGKAIRSQASLWLAEAKFAAGNKTKNVLDYLPLNIERKALDMAQLSTAEDLRPCLLPEFLKEDEFSTLKMLNKAMLTVHVEEDPYTGEFVEDAHAMRAKLPHGAWPDKVPMEKYVRVMSNLKQSRHNIEKLQRDLMQQTGEPAAVVNMVNFVQAEKFVYEVFMFLHRQPSIRENGVTTLFQALASIVGLEFRTGDELFARTMLILGHDVTAVTDLRAYANDFHQKHGEFWKQPGVHVRTGIHELKIAAIADVKAVAPNEENSLPMLGQMLAEMICEMPYSKHPDLMACFAVQNTKVRLCFLHLPKLTLDYIQNPEFTKRWRSHDGDRGTFYLSKEMDFLLSDDRNKLLEMMMRLAKKVYVPWREFY